MVAFGHNDRATSWPTSMIPATLNKLEQVDEPGSGKHVEYLFLQTFDIKVAMVGYALLIDSHQ
jgi:hypothetical protein